MWCSRLSPVIHASMNGYSITSTMNRPRAVSGMRMLNDQVRSHRTNSRCGGTRRSAPSANPMYQSGCVPAETGDGSYGP
jgi:hypothetical protein